MKVLDRYIFSEMLGPFFIGVGGFILVLTVDLLFTMTDLIINKGIPFWAVLKLLAFKLPSILVLTFPVSMLFSTAMALGRLSKDNEIVALRTSGVNLFRISAPILVFGISLSMLSFITNEHIVPRANQSASEIIRQIVYRQPLPEVRDNVFFKDAYNRYYYARRIDMKNKSMENVMVYEVMDEKYPRVILANSALFQGRMWELKDGVIHKYDGKGFLSYETTFADLKLNVAEDILNYGGQKTPEEMNKDEIKQMITMLGKSGANTNVFQTEYYMKYAIPFTCFVFALIGIPFSLPAPRSGRTWGMVVTIVFIFTFYVFASVFRSLGKGGIIPPFQAAFIPQVSFFFLGGILLIWQGWFK